MTMTHEFDSRLPPLTHQIVGASLGIIFCAWFTGVTPEQVALIRLPSTLILTTYVLVGTYMWIKKKWWPQTTQH